MDYTIAKTLKEAGFPLKPIVEDGEIRMYPPTLSELIEACGIRFKELIHNNSIHKTKPDWTAHAKGIKIEEKPVRWTKNVHTIPCASPEEAVARLWLELNKK